MHADCRLQANAASLRQSNLRTQPDALSPYPPIASSGATRPQSQPALSLTPLAAASPVQAQPPSRGDLLHQAQQLQRTAPQHLSPFPPEPPGATRRPAPALSVSPFAMSSGPARTGASPSPGLSTTGRPAQARLVKASPGSYHELATPDAQHILEQMTGQHGAAAVSAFGDTYLRTGAKLLSPEPGRRAAIRVPAKSPGVQRGLGGRFGSELLHCSCDRCSSCLPSSRTARRCCLRLRWGRKMSDWDLCCVPGTGLERMHSSSSVCSNSPEPCGPPNSPAGDAHVEPSPAADVLKVHTKRCNDHHMLFDQNSRTSVSCQ